MTEDQMRKISALRGHTFQSGTYPQRFVASLSTKPHQFVLNARMADYLDMLYYKYGRQRSQPAGMTSASPTLPLMWD